MAAVATRGAQGRPYKLTYQATAATGRGLALVQGASDDLSAVAAAANVQIIGVSEEPTLAAGYAQSVVVLGEATAIAGAAVAAGQLVINNAAGQFVPSAAAGDNIAGRALSSAAVAGDEFLMFVLPSIR